MVNKWHAAEKDNTTVKPIEDKAQIPVNTHVEKLTAGEKDYAEDSDGK